MASGIFSEENRKHEDDDRIYFKPKANGLVRMNKTDQNYQN